MGVAGDVGGPGQWAALRMQSVCGRLGEWWAAGWWASSVERSLPHLQAPAPQLPLLLWVLLLLPLHLSPLRQLHLLRLLHLHPSGLLLPHWFASCHHWFPAQLLTH